MSEHPVLLLHDRVVRSIGDCELEESTSMKHVAFFVKKRGVPANGANSDYALFQAMLQEMKERAPHALEAAQQLLRRCSCVAADLERIQYDTHITTISNKGMYIEEWAGQPTRAP